MSDIERAKAALRGHSVAGCRAGEVMTRDGRGIAPLLAIASEENALRGASVADLIVGKAAALLMARAGVSEVYAEVMSEAGERTLSEHDIPHSCGLLVPYIIDRTGKDVCPMERAVADVSDPAEAYAVLSARLELSLIHI
mgnify:FL=1